MLKVYITLLSVSVSLSIIIFKPTQYFTVHEDTGLHISEWFYRIYFVYSIATTLRHPELYVKNLRTLNRRLVYRLRASAW